VLVRRILFFAIQCFLLFSTNLLHASDLWDAPAFSVDPQALLKAAADLKPAKDMEVTVLLSEERFAFDSDGKLTNTHHLIYRIENEDGVKGWAETSGEWEPWRQAKPAIRARVITADGTVHMLDPKTLNDVPVQEEQPELYSDRRSYGGPLPAVAAGAIVEEEIVTRDTAPYFVGGTVERHLVAWNVPVYHARVVFSHPESLPLRYQPKLLPDATIKKSIENGQETITIENGFLGPYPEKRDHLPADVVPYAEIEFGTGISWQKVAEEYARLTNDKLRLSDVQPLLAKINSRGASRGELIVRIVAALHKNVRYTGVEFDQASLIPQFPSETLKRKYGDCKDKAALLVTMLRAAGIPANLALLDTGPGQDINVDLPGMGMFDHAIVYLPASGNDAEMWIDATDEYARPGDLPYMDYGRWALIVDEKTTSLKKIPELTAAQNVHRELREFTLPEFGLADIVEKDEQTGPRESEFREFYSGDAKKLRQSSEDYVKREYLADSLTSLNHGDLEDVSKPFSVTYVAKGKRGSTDFESASMAVRIEDLFYGLPQYFTSDDDEEQDKENASGKEERAERKPPRAWDWQIEPFINEWDYKISAPPGFKLRALPEAKELQLGPARLSQKFTANDEGTIVQAVLRFENEKPRLTITEAKALREAVVRAQKTDPIFVIFDPVGLSLIAAGKVKEGLAAYHDLARLHPKEALHRIQLARALLDLGLAESARNAAREAIALEPKSAQAYSTLGWILQHDLIGRRFEKGFDYDGAVAAYRKAKEFDPKDKDIRTNLAILLESDSDGVRYSEKSHLREAIAEFKELKQMDKDYMARYEDNVLYDLWYARDYKGLLEAASALPGTQSRKTLIVAALAADQGPEAAIKKSFELTTEEQGRSKVLIDAGSLLLRQRKYPETAELFSAGSHGQPNASQIATSVAVFKKTRPYQEIAVGAEDPRSAIQRIFITLLSNNIVTPDTYKPLFSRYVTARSEFSDVSDFQRSMSQLRFQLKKTGLPLETLLDITLSNFRYVLDGDENFGYRISLDVPGAATEDAYVVPEDGSWKIADFHASASELPEELAWQSLACLQKHDVAHARKWLDWARERIHINEGDDALSGQPFPHFWTKGQEGDETAIRTASLVLMPSKELKGEYLADLIRARDAAKNDDDRRRLNLVLAHAYAAQQQWSKLLEVSEKLMASVPESYIAFHFVEQAYAGLNRLEDWDRLLQSRLQHHPDDAEYIRSASRLEVYYNRYEKARELLKGLIERGKATEIDMNGYAWDALLTSAPPDEDAVEMARRASDLTKNSNFSILHTLACLYADTGKGRQAREVLLKAMTAADLEEPNSAVWFGFGEIADQYGEIEAARTLYSRVEKSKMEAPGTNYSLAQKRLEALRAADAPANNASH
jgi:transglutaminase-like putative cysteine protease/Flp pilus assembly protein TadD